MSGREETRGVVEPKRSRPLIPKEYGIVKGNKGMLEWHQVNALLESAPFYWLSTVSADGQPHAMPVDGLWVDNTLYFGGSPHTRWARNLGSNPRLVVHIEAGDVAVTLESVAEFRQPDDETFKRIAASSKAKYGYGPETNTEMWSARPRKAFAWSYKQFGETATRWRFGEDT
jgi:hypothetical protein